MPCIVNAQHLKSHCHCVLRECENVERMQLFKSLYTIWVGHPLSVCPAQSLSVKRPAGYDLLQRYKIGKRQDLSLMWQRNTFYF